MYHVYIPSITEDPIQPLRTKSQRTKLEYSHVLRAIQSARDIGGSSNTVMRAKTGRGDLDARITQVTCLTHRERMKVAFRDQRLLSVQWDPGTYSGTSYNIGLVSTTCASIGGEICGDLAPKVLAGG